jgi:archaeosortase B (VPXXXP-CTERM-specific)
MLRDRIRSAVNNPAYRFVGLFALFLGVEAVVYPMVTKRYFFVIHWMTVATAKIEYWMMVPFTSDASLNDNLVYLGDFGVHIIEECTGIFEVIIFVAAVLAFPTSWQKKAIGLGMGIPLLYVFNVVRILVLILVGRFHPASFEFMHIYFWQATLILMITSVWLLWIFKVVRHEEEPAAGPA